MHASFLHAQKLGNTTTPNRIRNRGLDSILRMLPLGDLPNEMRVKVAGLPEKPENALMQQIDLTSTALVHVVLLGRAANVAVEHAKLLRAFNREDCIQVATSLLRVSAIMNCNFNNQPDPGNKVSHMKRSAEGHLLYVCIQWVGLVCVEIINTNKNGTAWTNTTKMKSPPHPPFHVFFFCCYWGAHLRRRSFSSKKERKKERKQERKKVFPFVVTLFPY